LDLIQSKLSGWKANQLPLAGRITLAKACIQSIPTFQMQSAKLPGHVSGYLLQLRQKKGLGSILFLCCPIPLDLKKKSLCKPPRGYRRHFMPRQDVAKALVERANNIHVSAPGFGSRTRAN
jgi:hypothetical protein